MNSPCKLLNVEIGWEMKLRKIEVNIAETSDRFVMQEPNIYL